MDGIGQQGSLTTQYLVELRGRMRMDSQRRRRTEHVLARQLIPNKFIHRFRNARSNIPSSLSWKGGV
ncbi:unnamed protein product [Mycena citricolor]|uniref:Uncharacterized protein n=1 Tax=Mycena citricolor TaxID=2018698 RepID=A0AAD2HWL2_9AGAR|nr:unnamed protein product [Mycena citricolor]